MIYNPKIKESAELLINENYASISLLVRKQSLSYNEAAEIFEQLEGLSILGPFRGSKHREILVKKEQLTAIFIDNNL